MTRRIPPLAVLLFVADLGLIATALFLASMLRSALPLGRGGALAESAVQVPVYVYGIAVICWAAGLVASGAYDPQKSLRWFNEAWRVIWGSSVAAGLMAGGLYLSFRELSRLQFIYFYLSSVVLLLAYRALLRLYYRAAGKGRPGGANRILIAGAGELGQRLGEVILNHSRWGFELGGFIDDSSKRQEAEMLGVRVLGTIDQVQEIVQRERIDEVWAALPISAQRRLTQLVSALEKQPVRIKAVPDYFSLAMVRANTEVWGDIPVIGLRDPLIEGIPRLIKRGFDLIIGSLVLVVGFPVMALIAGLVRLTSDGPVILRQDRIGENGRVFSLYKFRTMVQNGQDSEPPVPDDGLVEHKRRDDPRVTRVGRFLRRWSLDELPQVWNVIRGDMSLVGPRPELPWLVDQYEPWQRKRFSVPQGITGWWQINGRSDAPMHLNTQDDLYYIYNYSLLLDLWILIRTPFAVLRGKGAF